MRQVVRTVEQMIQHELAHKALLIEMLSLTTQEIICWRMFGIDVEWDGECVYILI